MSANICNICGANLIYKDGKWVCPACGAFKTEEISNEEVTLLYNAAQQLRLASFDDAEEAYRDIIAKYPENSEAHWGLVLSKYGIKYEDDYDGKKLPTCYATSIESVLTDKDYLDAVRLCKDKYQKEYYIEQGKVLEKIRVEWLEKASKEPKYDVFLCFKDSDKLNNNMTNIELVLNMLAEVTTTAISKREQPDTFEESKTIAKRGGKVAKNARTDIESQLGQSVISPLNASDKPALEVKTNSDEGKD